MTHTHTRVNESIYDHLKTSNSQMSISEFKNLMPTFEQYLIIEQARAGDASEGKLTNMALGALMTGASMMGSGTDTGSTANLTKPKVHNVTPQNKSMFDKHIEYKSKFVIIDDQHAAVAYDLSRYASRDFVDPYEFSKYCFDLIKYVLETEPKKYIGDLRQASIVYPKGSSISKNDYDKLIDILGNYNNTVSVYEDKSGKIKEITLLLVFPKGRPEDYVSEGALKNMALGALMTGASLLGHAGTADSKIPADSTKQKVQNVTSSYTQIDASLKKQFDANINTNSRQIRIESGGSTKFAIAYDLKMYIDDEAGRPPAFKSNAFEYIKYILETQHQGNEKMEITVAFPESKSINKYTKNKLEDLINNYSDNTNVYNDYSKKIQSISLVVVYTK